MFSAKHEYLVYITGLNAKSKIFSSRKDAEDYMRKICIKNNITVECTEQDRHERLYSNHKGVRFYINRI